MLHHWVIEWTERNVDHPKDGATRRFGFNRTTDVYAETLDRAFELFRQRHPNLEDRIWVIRKASSDREAIVDERLVG